ncbi:MAG: hypothetical protein ACLFVJ_15870, partial [Persicimonas sp.]
SDVYVLGSWFLVLGSWFLVLGGCKWSFVLQPIGNGPGKVFNFDLVSTAQESRTKNQEPKTLAYGDNPQWKRKVDDGRMIRVLPLN